MSKFKYYKSEKLAVQQYLEQHAALASMVAIASETWRPNVYQNKRALEGEGVFIGVKKGICPSTEFLATYLSSNREASTPGQ